MKKIFVTVGNDYHSFHRLIEKIDNIASKIDAEFVIQYGYSDYIPKNIKQSHKFLDREEYNKKFGEADLIISHSGIGTMIDTIQKKKKMLLVPKQYKYGEHFNDHQSEIAEEVKGKYENIKVIYEVDGLENEINRFLSEKVDYPEPPDIKSLKLVKDIKSFIDNENQK
ncbi:MAG: glycosyltransferase [bacterium]|nr:glycosyltransferase [bacterium]